MIKVILSTVGSEEAAEKVARTLVEERLVACVNIVPKVRSVYRWKGAVQVEAEVMLVMKTTPERVNDALRRLKQIHPYEVPEMIALDVKEGWLPYLTWVRDETRAATATMA